MTTRALQIGFLLSGLIDPLTGSPLTGGTVEFYVSGTTTPKNVWTEPERTNAYTSRTLAAGGVYQIYGEGIYRVVVKRSNGTTIWTWDNIKIEYPSSTVSAITGSTTQTTDHDFILANANGGDVTYSLLPAASWTHPVTVKNIGAANNIIVDASGSETIDGAATHIISASNQAITFFSNGSNIYKSVGYVLRVSTLVVADGTTADTINCTLNSSWNGDEIAETNNIPKDGSAGSFALSANGKTLTIAQAALSGTSSIAVIGVWCISATTALSSAISPIARPAGEVGIYVGATYGTESDLATIVDTGGFTIYISYLTNG